MIAIALFQELPPFEYVEINGMKLPDPNDAYALIW